MQLYILIREFVLDYADTIVGVLMTICLGGLFGLAIGGYLAESAVFYNLR